MVVVFFIWIVLSGILFIVARPRSAEERKIMKRKEEVIKLLESGMDWNTIVILKQKAEAEDVSLEEIVKGMIENGCNYIRN